MKNGRDDPRAYDSLISYALMQWPGYRPQWFHHEIAGHLEAVERGDIRRLMIFMPPRHGKSMLTSEYFPAWYLGRNPEKMVIAASYNQDKADDFGRKVRNQLFDPVYSQVFGTELRPDSKSVRRFHVTQGGEFYAVGIGGPITGRGAHLLLIDDPIKDYEEARSARVRQMHQDWYATVARTRLMPGGSIVVIQTRWHDDDLSGWLLSSKHEDWTVLSIPACDEDMTTALWPSDYPIEELRKIRAINPAAWQALYMQRPVAVEGAIIKRDQFRIDEAFSPDYTIQAWDTAYKTGESADYSVCVTLGANRSGYHIMHAWRGRVEYPDLLTQARRLYAEFAPSAVIIEDRASGQSLIQSLQRETRQPIIPVMADKDKVTRLTAIAPLFASGRVSIPNPTFAPWANDLIDELCLFPAGAHDDQVDAVAHGLAYLSAGIGLDDGLMMGPDIMSMGG